MEKKLVVATDHGPVPMKENSRRYIRSEPVLVPMNAYYLRRIHHGELRVVEAPPEPSTTVAASTRLPGVIEPGMTDPLPIDLGEEK